MIDKKGYSLFVLLCAAVIGTMMLTAFALDAKAELASLEVTDCVKCHQEEPATIASNGGKHKTAVTCLDCHQEHPPWGEEVIPACSMCHEGRSHFELENCLSCHSNPHEPLALHLADDIKEPCLTCHEGPGQDFANYESAHAEQSCTFCHEVHGQIPDCVMKRLGRRWKKRRPSTRHLPVPFVTGDSIRMCRNARPAMVSRMHLPCIRKCLIALTVI